MNKIIEPFVYIAAFSALAYYAYKSIKDGLEPPPMESRNLVVAYDDDGNPVYDPDCDIDSTLELWKEQSRLFRNA